jgi:hypothetical protein
MPQMNFDLEDGLPPVSFSLKTDDADRFMQFMQECNDIKTSAAPQAPAAQPVAWIEYIDGQISQNVARSLDEKNQIESISRSMSKPGSLFAITWVELFDRPPAAQPMPMPDADKQIQALQAKIDRLMLEYCPREMSHEQVEEWAKHQVPATTPRLLVDAFYLTHYAQPVPMTDEQIPSGWKFVVKDSDGRTWLNITTPQGDSAALSCKSRNDSEPTIASCVLHRLARDIAEQEAK